MKAKIKIRLNPNDTMTPLRRKNRKVLLRTGFFGRRVMRNSIRKAPKKYRPQPGKPPRYHTRPGIKTVLFAIDDNAQAVDIGVLKYRTSGWIDLGNQRYRQRVKGGKTIPELVDQGGGAIREIEYVSGQTRSTTANYAAFPFTDPAVEPTADKMFELMESIPLN